MKVVTYLIIALLVLTTSFGLFLLGRYQAKLAREPAALFVSSVSPERQQLARDLAEAAFSAGFAGEWDRAIELFKQARETDPDLRGIDLQLARCEYERGDYAAAEVFAQRSLDREESECSSHLLLARAALAKAQQAGSLNLALEPVMARLEMARRADPTNPEPFFHLAEVHRLKGQPAEALLAYQRAVERLPGTDNLFIATVKAGLSGLRLHAGDEARPVLTVPESGPVPPEQLYFAAADALLRNKVEEGEALLQRVRPHVPAGTFQALLKDSFFLDYLPAEAMQRLQEPSKQG